MHSLDKVAPAFVKMAHQIVWASVATVDPATRPRSRILHPVWEWDGDRLTGWIGTSPTPVKRSHLKHSPYMSLNYWTPSHDTCVAECRVEWLLNDEARTMVWNKLKNAPPPVGYDPAIVPAWTSSTADTFAGLKLTPWRLRVFPGTVLMGQGGEVLVWGQEA